MPQPIHIDLCRDLPNEGGALPSARAASLREEWRKVPGLRQVEVSDRGKVFDCRGERFPALVPDSNGYPTARIHGKRYLVHRLVCRAFHGARPSLEHVQVAHLDGSKDNNAASNLTWATPRENNAHKRGHGTHQAGEKHPRVKLSAAQVAAIRERAAGGEALRSIAPDFGIHETYAGKLVSGQRWKEGA